jgi:molybdate transport repressor ModE-like protein
MDRKHWHGVDQRHMAALAAIAEEGSFRAAADSLGYVQSAVSDQITHLERCVGLPLVRRRRGSAAGVLTEAGQRLLGHFEAISTQFAAAQAEMANLRDGGGRGGRLRIGVYESAAAQLLPGVLLRFQRAEPGVEVEVVERGCGEDLVRLVAAGEADAAFGTLPLGEVPLRWRQLLRDPYVLLLPADWPLARAAEAPELAQLAGLPLVGPEDSPAARLLEDELRAAGVEPGYALRSGRYGVVRAMVAAGIGAAVVPRMAVEAADERVVVRELEPRLSPQTIVVFWHADRSAPPGLDRFVKLAADRATWIRDSRLRTAQPAATQPAPAQPATVTLIGCEAPFSKG